MIYWAPLLHFYQPPTQTYEILERVCNESYRPLVKLLLEEPSARLTVNINAVLTEMLERSGMGDVVSGLRVLAEAGTIEFTGSAKYHPILPLIPRKEMVRQIELNYETNRRYFGEIYQPRGFFSPEMCYSREIVNPVRETGHRWLILSGVACPAAWPTSSVYGISGSGLSAFFRDDILSNRISFQNISVPGFLDFVGGLAGRNGDVYVITAMDAETYGHHIKNWEEIFLRRLLTAVDKGQADTEIAQQMPGHVIPAVKIVTLSRLLDLFPGAGPVEPRPSSWSTSIDDIKSGNPYPLWNSPGNQIQAWLWRHLYLAMELTDTALKMAKDEPACEYAGDARAMLDQAEHSCPFWWAAQKPLRNLSLIYRGLSQQTEVILNAYRAIEMSNPGEKAVTECHYRVIAAADLRNKITDALVMS